MNMTTNSCSFDLREINFQFRSRQSQSQFDSSNRQKLDRKFEYIPLHISFRPFCKTSISTECWCCLDVLAAKSVRLPLWCREEGFSSSVSEKSKREKWMERETTKSVSLNAISKRSRYMWIHLRSKDQLNKLKERLLIILRFFTFFFSETSSWIVASVDSWYFCSAVLRVVVVQRATSSSSI